MRRPRWESLSTSKLFLSLLFLFPLLLSGCAASDDKRQSTVSPFASPESARDIMAGNRSPSAMEAMSRGIAAVTPPGAALKDIYYEFDAIDLRPEAQEILTKNA